MVVVVVVGQRTSTLPAALEAAAGGRVAAEGTLAVKGPGPAARLAFGLELAPLLSALLPPVTGAVEVPVKL
jgi:hypothetical protein